MTMIAINAIHPSASNARITASDKMSDEALRASITSLGMLQPILVQPNGEGYTVVAGHRRLAAAAALGWTEVPAVTLERPFDGTTTLAASAAENMVRVAMRPVDQWRAVAALTDQGMSLDGAADALGLPHSLARRLHHLGHMAPPVIEALAREAELPHHASLRVISSAPHEVQTKALGLATRAGRVDWWRLTQACETTRIPISMAIFDTQDAGVQFDEDLFAEPDDQDRWTTADLAGFIEAQEDALKARAEASKGRMTMLPWSRAVRVRDAIPKAWVSTYDPVPKRWKKTDPRHVFATVVREGHEIGRVEAIVAYPRPAQAAAVATASGVASDVKRERAPITKATYARIAGLRGEALRDHLPVLAKDADPARALAAVLMLFAARNLSVQTTSQVYGRNNLAHVIAGLVNEDGSVKRLGAKKLCALAGEVIERVVMFDHPNSFTSSGPVADWIAGYLAMPAPRFDTDEVLKGVAGEVLIDLAEAAGIDTSGKVGEVRKRLVGHLPDWQPAPFQRATTGGTASDDLSDDDDGEGDEDAA